MAKKPDHPPTSLQSLERLVRAGIRINAERQLDRVLQEVADSAREVIGARYAALGVLNEAGTGLGLFVTSGLTPDEHARIGALPQGKGILGLLISDPKPLLLRDLSHHPQSYGFPANHPPMRSFLGVPITGRHGPIGNLYLTEKETAAEFSDEDETIAIMLAAQAAGAVENARLNEEAQRLLGEVRTLQQSRDRFYATINHELRNALTAVYGWSDLLIRRGSDLPRAAHEVYESAERTLTLLNDLLDLSRLDASRLQPIVRDADVRQIVHEAIQAVLPAASARGIRLESNASPDGGVTCRTDPGRVRQILINLLTNAVRHSPDGEAVTVELRPSDTLLRIDVVDQGEGLTADQQAVIFDAFVRGAGENERGTGLGLTLSRQLARLLGGELKVQSAPGGGARFIVELARFLTA
jgi:two-component system, NarL family, sensor histidine kinase DevS